MPLSASDYQSSLGQNPPGTLANFNPGEFGDTYHVPVINQEDTFTVGTGAADTGWAVTILNSTTGDSTDFTFDPVDSAGVASATTADAATSLLNAWNSNPRALEFGRASLDSASVVRVIYSDDRSTYATTFVEAGLGDITVAIAIASSLTNIEVGTFAFRSTDALVNAGASPLALVSATSALIEQFVGGVARRGSLTNPNLDSTLTYPVYTGGQNAPVAQRARMHVRAAVAVRVTDPPSAVTTASAGVRVGWLTTGAGLTLTDVKITRGAPAGGIAVVEFTIA